MNTPRAGAMRNRITFQTKTAGTPSEYGDSADTWSDVCSLWAEVISLDGGELYRAKQVHAEATLRVTVRYDSRITPDGRFVFGSRCIYPISVAPDQLNRFATCICRERVGEVVSG